MAAVVNYCLVLFLLPLAVAHNDIEIESSTVYRYPGEGKNSLFGSVVGRSKKWLLIGAPRDSSRKGYGSLFYCKPGKANSCKRMPYHKEAFYWNLKVLDKISQSTKESKNGPSNSQPSMTCFTPSLSEKVFKSGQYSGCGMCWVTSSCKNNPKDIEKGKMFSPKTCVDEVSAALLKGGQRQLLMIHRGSWSSPDASNLTMESEGKSCEDPSLYIKAEKGKLRGSVQPHRRMDETNGFRGLSSTTVDFDGDGESDYVVGLPFSDSGTGSIEIYNKALSLIGSISGVDVLENGSSFGSALTATDLNGDGFDDIVVGAPDFEDKINPNGQVFIFYLRMMGDDPLTPPGIIKGFEGNVHFGSVLSGIGDINDDGYNDLCVGDPYHDGNIGKVYIYYGAMAGSLKLAKEISGSDFTPLIRNFGVAISSGQVSSSNLDILVGGENAAVQMRTRLVLHLDIQMSIEPRIIDLERKYYTDEDGVQLTMFEVTTCIQYNQAHGTDQFLVLEVSLDIDAVQPRAVFVNNLNSSDIFNVNIRNGKTVCDKGVAVLTDESDWKDDMFTPIRAQASLYTYPEAENKKGKSSLDLQPILAPSDASTQANIVKGCGDDSVCVPNLYINGSLTLQESEKGEPEIEMMTIVGNAGENAFKVRLLISPSQSLSCWTLRDYDNLNCSRHGRDPTNMDEKCNLHSMISSGEEITATYIFDLKPGNSLKTCISQFTGLTLGIIHSANFKDVLSENYQIISFELPYEQSTTSEKPMTNDVSDDMTIPPQMTAEPPHMISLSGKTAPMEINEKFDGTITNTFVVTNDGVQSLDGTLALRIVWPAQDDRGGDALALTIDPAVEGNGKCNITSSDCSALESMTEHRKMGKDEIVVESPKNCTLIECFIEEMAPDSTFSVTTRSALDVKTFLKNRKEAYEEDDVKAYHFMIMAHLSGDGVFGNGRKLRHVVTLKTKPKKTENASARINGDAWKYILLVFLVQALRLTTST